MTSAAIGLGHVISHHTVHHQLQQHGIRAYRPFRVMTFAQATLTSDENRFQLLRADGRTRIYQKENSSVLCWGDCTVWWSICDGLGRDLWPTADRPYCHWWKSYNTPLLGHGGHAHYWNMFFVVIMSGPIWNHVSLLVVFWTVVLSFYGFYWVYSCLFITKLLYFQNITFASTCVLCYF